MVDSAEDVALPPLTARSDHAQSVRTDPAQSVRTDTAPSVQSAIASFRRGQSSRASMTARGLGRTNRRPREMSVIGSANGEEIEHAQILAATCRCRARIPGLFGEWGPFFNVDLTREEWWALLKLCGGTLLLFFTSGIAAYFYRVSRLDFKCDDLPFKTTVSYFLNLDATFLEFCLGMVQGIIFGAIDNGGLWAGMDAMDPLFNPDKVPWVYGRGGRRFFSGLNHRDACVYFSVEFLDGKMNAEERGKVENICREHQEEYDRLLQANNLSCTGYNEACYADPKSPLFLGSGVPKNIFITMLSQCRLNAQTYKTLLEVYSTQRKHQEEGLEIGTGSGFDDETGSVGRDSSLTLPLFRDEICSYFRTNGTYPGKSKKLADAMIQGWEPGRLTQAGIGNTFSDMVGGVVSVFIATMIITATGQCTNSLVSEVLGLVVGCLLGMAVCRMLSSKS